MILLREAIAEIFAEAECLGSSRAGYNAQELTELEMRQRWLAFLEKRKEQRRDDKRYRWRWQFKRLPRPYLCACGEAFTSLQGLATHRRVRH